MVKSNSWRPQGWKNPISKYYSKAQYGTVTYRPSEVQQYERETFERGADAMLEALRKQGISIGSDGRYNFSVDNETVIDMSVLPRKPIKPDYSFNCTVVFIPDDK